MKSKFILVLFITGMTLIGIGAYPKIQSGHYLDFVGPDDFIIWGKYKIFKNIAIKLITF